MYLSMEIIKYKLENLNKPTKVCFEGKLTMEKITYFVFGKNT